MDEVFWSLVAEGFVLIGCGVLLVRRGEEEREEVVLLLCVVASTMVTVGSAL